MNSLKVKYGHHRKNVYDDVVNLYATNDIIFEYPLRIEFKDEYAIDIGGVCRDMYSAFFEECYRRFFEVSPAIHPGTDLSILPIVGSIISHAYLVSGILPIRVAFPCLAAFLVPKYEVPDDIFMQSFIDSLSIHDAAICKQALSQIHEESFSTVVLSGLQTLFSFYGCREFPKPQTLKKLLLQVAKFEFLAKPYQSIKAIQSGIVHLSFWNKMSLGELHSIYVAMSVSRTKVLNLIEGCTTCNPEEERVLSYLRQLVGDMHLNDLRLFIQFITGSSVLTAEGINITFNSSTGLGRRPLSHTCSCTLELSTTYVTYTDFCSEWNAILKSEESFTMDSL